MAAVAVSICFGTPAAHAITLKGSNGKEVEFHSIHTATPKGITAQIAADSPVIGIPWEKLDLTALATDHPEIHAAYLKAQAGETVTLAGISEGMKKEETETPEKPAEAPPKYEGWVEVQVGKMEFMLQLPGAEPRGVLLISTSDYGSPFTMVSHHERGNGVWSEFQDKHAFALLSYDARTREPDPRVLPEFVKSDMKGGQAVLSALSAFASKLNKPALADLPIAVYGAERTGAAFAYNFIQNHPERVLAATLSKGAFYDVEPTAESVKVPVMFLWGEYSNDAELWASENTELAVLAKVAPMKPFWTNAREFRGSGDLNAAVEYFGKQYLREMIPLRMPAEAPAPAKPAEGEAAEAPAEAAPAPASKPKLKDLDRSKGMVGNLETGETTNLSDPDKVMGENETYLPNQTVAKLWKQLLEGTLEAPAERGKVE